MTKKAKTKAVKAARKIKKTTSLSQRMQPIFKKLSTYKSVLNFKFISKVTAIVLLGLALFLLAQKYRGFVIAGIVNKTPITRWQLNQELVKRYGQEVFYEIVSNELIKQEASKLKVSVAKDEIAAEIKKIEEKLGGTEELNKALVQYGLTQTELERQIQISLLQRKIVEQKGSFEATEDEIKEYFTTNAAAYVNQKLEDVKAEIASLLKEQKMQTEFGRWFNEIKTKAQIESYFD